MNITIKISDQICRDARHRAVDAGTSLSGWIADVVRKELARSASKKPQSLLEALGNDALADVGLDFPRSTGGIREADFS